MMSFYIFILLFPIIFQTAANKMDEEKLATDMADLQANVEDIANLDKNEEDSEEVGENVNVEEPHEKDRKFDRLVSNIITNSASEINKEIAKEYEDIEIHNKVFSATLKVLKKFWFTGQCKRDYSLPCPKGWALEDEYCTPPDTYTGNCKQFNVNQVAGSEQKESFAFKCNAGWPCVNQQAQNYNAVCPYSWTHIGNNYCIAPSNYSMKCSPFMKLSHLSKEERAICSNRCDLHWPLAVNPSPNTAKKSDSFGALSYQGQIMYPVNY